MAIRFNCPCGQTITAKNEFAGRKVQCSACKKVLVVPGVKAAAPTRTVPPPAMPRSSPLPPPAPSIPTPPPRAPEPHLELPPPMETSRAASPFEGDFAATPHVPAPEHEVFEAAAEESEPAVFDSEPEPEQEAVPTLAMPVRASGTIRFCCSCGAEYQALAEHAGQPTRCPTCDDIFFIPTRGQAARMDGRPIQVGIDDERRYRPKHGDTPMLVKLVLALLVLGIIGGGGYAYWEHSLKQAVDKREQKKEREENTKFVVQVPQLPDQPSMDGPPGQMGQFGQVGRPPGQMGQFGQFGQMGRPPGQMGQFGQMGQRGQMGQGGQRGQMGQGGQRGQMGGPPPGLFGQMGGPPPGAQGQMGGQVPMRPPMDDK